MPDGSAKYGLGCHAAPRRGRPVQMTEAERRALVLDATARLLAEARLDEVTMAAICRRAGMSKRTVYGLFASRETLLGACLARISASLFRPLPPEREGRPLEERLRELLTVAPVPFLQEDTPLEILRVVIAEARAYPDLARSIVQDGSLRVVRLVAEELRRAVRAGELELEEDGAEEAAQILFDMVCGNVIGHLLDPAPACCREAGQAARRDRAIAIFLRGLERR